MKTNPLDACEIEIMAGPIAERVRRMKSEPGLHLMSFEHRGRLCRLVKRYAQGGAYRIELDIVTVVTPPIKETRP